MNPWLIALLIWMGVGLIPFTYAAFQLRDEIGMPWWRFLVEPGVYAGLAFSLILGPPLLFVLLGHLVTRGARR